MKTPIPHNKKRLIIIASVAVALLIIGSISAIYINSTKEQTNTVPTNGTIDNNPPTEEQLKAGQEVKKQTIEEDKPTDASSNQSGKVTPVNVIITAAEQSKGQLVIRALIYTVSNEGACTLTLQKNDGAIVTKTAKVQASASSSTCEGFDVPVSELSSGEWRITVSYKSETLEGAAGHTVTVN